MQKYIENLGYKTIPGDFTVKLKSGKAGTKEKLKVFIDTTSITAKSYWQGSGQRSVWQKRFARTGRIFCLTKRL